MTFLAQYSCAANPFSTVVSAPNDVFTITGNNSKLTRISKMGISTSQSTTGVNPWCVVKRSTPNINGTPINPSIVSFDSLNPSPSSIITFYIQPPNVGNLVGSIKSFYLDSPSLTDDGIGAQFYVIDFIDLFAQPLILRTDQESISFNFLGASLPTGFKIAAFARWTEEN